MYKSPRITITTARSTTPQLEETAHRLTPEMKRQESNKILKNITMLTLPKNDDFQDRDTNSNSTTVSLDDFDDNTW